MQNGVPTALIKYYIIFEVLTKPLTAYIEMQKVGDRWFQTAIPNNAEIGAMFMRFESDKLQLLLSNKDTNDLIIKDIRGKIKTSEGAVDLKKLYQIYNSWYSSDPQKVDYFIDKNAW